jgi:hypothetical protein
LRSLSRLAMEMLKWVSNFTMSEAKQVISLVSPGLSLNSICRFIFMFLSYYAAGAVPLTTSPDTGQVTERVARSPTAPAKGWYWVTRAVKRYSGLVAVTVPDVGAILTATVEPMSGYSSESTEPAPKSWWKSRDTEASFSPPMRVRYVEPKAVVSTSSVVMSRVTDAIESLSTVVPIVTL